MSAVRRLLVGTEDVVVADDRVALPGHVPDELLELEPDQPALAAELDAVARDALRHPRDHLGPLEDDEDVVEHDGVLELERGQAGQHLLEPLPIRVERPERLVRLREDVGDGVELVPRRPDEDRDRLPLLRDGDDERAGLLRDALGRAVSGAGLVGRDRRVRHELDVRPREPLDRLVDDDRAVHLRELVEELRPERRVELDAAGVEERELVRVADHDQRALVRADDVVDGLAEPGARRNLGDRREQLRVLAARIFLGGDAREAEIA